MLGGIVLCGGRSTRMGRPKAWLPVGGEPMLCRVVRTVAEVCGPVLVVAAPGQELPPRPVAIEVVRDVAEGNGPLQGLTEGLSALVGRAEAAVVTACDAPFLSPAFLRRLVDLRGTAPACVPVADGFPRPLPGVYAVAVLAEARSLLSGGRYRLGELIERLPARLAVATEFADADPTLASLRNVNTPDDYARALADLGLAAPDSTPPR